MRFLSSSASAPKTVMIIFPTGVLVSILSETEMKCKPHGYSCPNEELAFPDEEKQNPREEITFPAQEKQNANEESAFPDEEKQNPNEELAFPDEEKQNPRVEITLPAQEKQNPSEEGGGFCRLRFGSSRLVRYSPRRRADRALVRIYARGELIKTHSRQKRGGPLDRPYRLSRPSRSIRHALARLLSPQNA